MTQPRTPGKPKVPNRRNTFNLDTLKKDAEAPKPLPVILDGQEFLFEDINEGERRELQQLEENDTDGQIRAMLGDEQYERFEKLPMPLWKWEALWAKLDDHFGYSVRAGSQGEDSASPTS